MACQKACTLAFVHERPVSRVGREDGRRLFGLDPAAYAAGRPGYPAALFEILVERCGLAPGTPTLEIGAGAGQATDELLARGAQPLTVVEPDPGSAAYLLQRFGDAIRVVVSAFEDAPLDRESFALAMAASSWHWVDQQVGLSRVAGVLQPVGWWAAFWNILGTNVGSEPDALREALDPILPSREAGAGCPANTEEFVLDREARIRDLQACGFVDVEVAELGWVFPLDPVRGRALYGTFSPVLALPPDERERILGEVATVIAERFDGLFERRCVTVIYTARRA
jgi:SAM-dependent methyltransferase